MSWITDILSNPLNLIIGINVIIVIAGIGTMLLKRLRVSTTVYYFSEGERLYEPIRIDVLSPKSLYATKRDMRFIRTGTAYKNRIGNQIIWLAKRGTAYLFRLEQPNLDREIEVIGEDGEKTSIVERKPVAKKLGTLWEGLKLILSEELIDQFTTDVKEKLMNPEILLTVELEDGSEPLGLPKMDEKDIYDENSARMSQLIFSGVKEAMSEDWVRAMGLIAMGVAVTLVAQNLGLM